MALGSIFGQRTDLSNVSGILGPENGGTGGNSLTQFGTLLYKGSLTNNISVDIDGSCSLYYGIINITAPEQNSSPYRYMYRVIVNNVYIADATYDGRASSAPYGAHGFFAVAQHENFVGSIYMYSSNNSGTGVVYDENNVVYTTNNVVTNNFSNKLVFQNGGYDIGQTWQPLAFAGIAVSIVLYGIHSFA